MDKLGPNATVVRRLHGCFNEGRVDEILAGCTEDVVMDAAALGRRFEGKAAFREFLRTFLDAFPDIALEWESHRETVDGVVVQFRWRGTHRGVLQTPKGPIPPTGRTVEGLRVCEVFTLRDGKVTAIANYQDTGALLDQLGLLG